MACKGKKNGWIYFSIFYFIHKYSYVGICNPVLPITEKAHLLSFGTSLSHKIGILTLIWRFFFGHVTKCSQRNILLCQGKENIPMWCVWKLWTKLRFSNGSSYVLESALPPMVKWYSQNYLYPIELWFCSYSNYCSIYSNRRCHWIHATIK